MADQYDHHLIIKTLNTTLNDLLCILNFMPFTINIYQINSTSKLF